MKAIVMLVAILPSVALAGSLFPANPVPMREGYGKDGAGTHFAVPEGIPGPDCVVNPVSLKNRTVMTTKIEQHVEKKIVPGTIISIPANVLFDFDKSDLRSTGKTELEQIKKALDEGGVEALSVVGHTDSKGSDDYNLKLGHKRASAVAEYLIQLGFNKGAIIALSQGEFQPIAPNAHEDGSDNPEGRQKNRRVNLVVEKVKDVVQEEVITTEIPVETIQERNPQIFHVLASGNKVICTGDPTPPYWGFGYSR